MLNTQEMFNQVVGHMRAQGRPRSGFGNGLGIPKWSYINPEDPCQRCAKGILMDTLNATSLTIDKIVSSKCIAKITRRKEYYEDMGLARLNEYCLPDTNAELYAVEDYLGRDLSHDEIVILNNLERIFETLAVYKWEGALAALADRFKLSLPTNEGQNLFCKTNTETVL